MLRRSQDRILFWVPAAVFMTGATLSMVRFRAGEPIRRSEAGLYIFATLFCTVVAWLVLRHLRRPKLPAMHLEYVLRAPRAAELTVADLVERLASQGRRLELAALDDLGQPGAAPPGAAPLVGTQVQLRLVGDVGPGRLLLRLRREDDASVFGLLEIDDDGSYVHRRLGADLIAQLAAPLPGLAFGRLGSGPELQPATSIEAGEAL